LLVFVRALHQQRLTLGQRPQFVQKHAALGCIMGLARRESEP
jgi:hypothetical protein